MDANKLSKALAKSLREVEAYEAGKLTLKVTEVTPPHIDVKTIRSKVGLSQAEFARTYGFNTATLRNWEQGVREPEGPARILLALIERNPELIASEVGKLRAVG
jgi:putative transcriptional regulator